MSKWLDESDFESFRKNLNERAEEKNFDNGPRVARWDVKNMKGTLERPNVYEIRFLPEKSKTYYTRIFYHMIKSNEKWNYMLCEKTFGAEEYCPLCAASNKLYLGNADDKIEAKRFRKNDKYVANVLIIEDPRDGNIQDEEKKATGKVMLYEFPNQVEKILREEINDRKHGVGMSVFDPSEEGYDFVLSVGAKPAEGGKTWPNYALKAARKPRAIADTDDEINAILEKTYDLKDYVEKSRTSKDRMIAFLKGEFTYELIKEDYEKRFPKEEKEDEPKKDETPKERVKEETKKAEDKPIEKKKEEPKKNKSEDDELLAELDSLGI